SLQVFGGSLFAIGPGLSTLSSRFIDNPERCGKVHICCQSVAQSTKYRRCRIRDGAAAHGARVGLSSAASACIRRMISGFSEAGFKAPLCGHFDKEKETRARIQERVP